MGTGKTSVGRELAALLGMGFVDTDQVIEERHGPIPQIFVQSGEDVFRDYERQLAAELAEQENLVVSTGGRLMLDDANAEVLGESGIVFALHASAEEILRRVLADEAGADRPLLAGDDPATNVRRLLGERAAGYGRFTIVKTEGRDPNEIAVEIARLLSD
jgi:shikimate kinase